uniref:Uncharacterized protein n=1 Tax=Timema tahoe TaxID=61484 RepID=A0A7R9FHZ3_9NEOP|nr:unnamed protein product [Timema tahoe]
MFFQPPFPHIDLFFNPSWSLYTSKEDISRHAALIEGANIFAGILDPLKRLRWLKSLLSVFQRGRKNFYVIIFVVVLFIVFSQVNNDSTELRIRTLWTEQSDTVASISYGLRTTDHGLTDMESVSVP